MSILSFCMMGVIILWVLSDLLSSPLKPEDISYRVWICYVVAFLCMFSSPPPHQMHYLLVSAASGAFGLYLKSKLYYHWTSRWISMCMLFVIGVSISLCMYPLLFLFVLFFDASRLFDSETIFHFYHMLFFLCICFLCIHKHRNQSTLL